MAKVETHANGGLPFAEPTPIVVEAPTVYAAARKGDLDEVESLLTANPSVSTTEEHTGKPALAAAAAGNHAKVVKRLIEAGVPDTVCRGWTAACHAAFYGHVETLTVLLEKQGAAAVGAPAGVTMTPLLLACLKGRQQCVELILNAAPTALAARDSLGRTALMLAATSGNVELIRWLATEKKVALEETSVQGETALLWAVTAHQGAAVSALVQLGADPDARLIPDPDAAVIPGKDRTIGNNAAEIAGETGRDPMQKFVANYLKEYAEHRAQSPGTPMPPMPPFAHVTHAEEFVKAEAAAAEAAKAAAAAKADEPQIEEALALADESDIFGAEDVPSGASAVPRAAAAKPMAAGMLIEEIEPEAEAHKDAAQKELSMAKAESAGDLDALD